VYCGTDYALTNRASNERRDEGNKDGSLCSPMLVITIFSMVKNGLR
jgi:hypothetical protein